MSTGARRRVFSLLAVVVVVSGAASSGVASATSSGPYPSGTLFIADQDCACVWEVPPSGTPSLFVGQNQSPQDVAVDAAGDLFWTELQSGAVKERDAGGTQHTLASGYAPTGIAVDATGDVFFSSFGGNSSAEGLYEIPSGTSTPQLVAATEEWSNIAIDGNGDLYGATGADQLAVIPAGTSTPLAVQVPKSGGGDYEINGVRLDGSDDLYASTAFYSVGIELAAGGAAPTATFDPGTSRLADGVAVDAAGDVFLGDPSTTSGNGYVSKFTGGVRTTYDNYELAYTSGMATYPAVQPKARTATSTSLTTTGTTNPTTIQKVTVTATVPGGGFVQFDEDGQPLGDPVAVSSRKAEWQGTLSKGSHSITALYLGRSGYAPSVSSPLTFTVRPLATHTDLETPGSSVPGDQPMAVSVTVTSARGTPTGDVTFVVNGQDAGDAALDGSGQASTSLALRPGVNRIHAIYDGDPQYASSTSGRTVTADPPFVPTLSTTTSLGQPDGQGVATGDIHVVVAGFSAYGAPTGTVSADSGFTCGTLVPAASGAPHSTTTCHKRMRNNEFDDVTVTFTTSSSNYDSASTEVSISNEQD